MKLIIFDMDGVLFDSIGFAQKTFIERHPGVTDEMYREMHSGNYHEEAKKYSHLKIRESKEEEEIFKADYAEKKAKTLLFKDIKNLLVDLHNKGYLLVINSNAYDRNCLPLLERFGIRKLFDFVATAELSKDKIEKFKIIKNKYKAENKDILFITDALGDVKDADIAGIPTVAVTWGVHDELYFNRESHNNLVGIIDSVAKLKDFIFSNNF